MVKSSPLITILWQYVDDMLQQIWKKIRYIKRTLISSYFSVIIPRILDNFLEFYHILDKIKVNRYYVYLSKETLNWSFVPIVSLITLQSFLPCFKEHMHTSIF